MLTHIIVLSLAFAGPGSVLAQSTPTAVELDEALANLNQAREALDAADAVRPDAYWYADDLSFDLAFESPATISEWVGTNIAYQPYRGLLRGADGTLRARAGNAWDQALLLTRLLLDAGYSAQIVFATLGDGAALELANQASVGQTPEGDVDATIEAYLSVDGSFAQELADLASSAAAEQEATRAATDDMSTWLLDRLEAAGITLESNALEEAIADAQDYAWVQYRTSADEAWTNAHPAAPEGASWTGDLVAEGVLEDSVPADRQHRFRVQAFVERRAGSKLETSAVMEAWERPVANLNAFGLSYIAIPDGFLQQPALPADEAFEATQFVTPVFNGALAPGGQLFDLLGNVVPPDAAANPAAGVFAEVGGAFGEAAGGLTGEEEAVALTAHWLEFTFITPGGEEVRERRMIFDRLGDARRAAGDGSGDLIPMSDAEIYQALQTEYTFLLAPGRYADAFVGAWNSQAARTGLDYLEDLYLASSEDATAVAEPGEDVPEVLRTAPLLRAVAEFDDPYVRQGDVVTYRPSPALLVRSQAWGVETVMTDIVRNDRRAFTRDGGSLVGQPEAVLRAGVWESSVERAALDASGAAIDATTFFAAVRAQGIETTTLQTETGQDAAGLDLPEASRRAIARDLEAGYAVVAPVTMPDGFQTAAWWRVDPTSGVTLGRGGDGRGQAALDYIVLVNSIFIGVVGFGMCRAGGGSMGCCIADAATGVAGGMILGALLYGFSAAAVATGGILFDVGGLAAGGAGLSWCLMESNAPSPTAPELGPVLVRGPSNAPTCSLEQRAAIGWDLSSPWHEAPMTVGLRSSAL